MKPDPKPTTLANAINYMNRLITAGIDYSDAQWRVSQCYPQFSAEVIAEAYDQQFDSGIQDGSNRTTSGAIGQP